MGLYLPVLYGSVRESRVSIRVANYTVRRLAARPNVETRLFDPRDLPFGNLVRREWEWPDPPAEVPAFTQEMARADGFVIVTPEYNYGMPGTLKNLLDHLWDEWNQKPFALVGAGGISGGLRAIDALRMVIPGLGGFTIPAHVSVHQVGAAFDEEGPVKDAAEYEKRFDRMFTELEWYAQALRGPRLELASRRA